MVLSKLRIFTVFNVTSITVPSAPYFGIVIQSPTYIDNNFPSMVKLLYLCMTDSLGGGWLS